MNIIYSGRPEAHTVREVLGGFIPELLGRDPRVFYLDADLMTCINTVPWAFSHHDRAENCGIAEANMVGIAAGMASEGFRPIVHSFGTFASRRVYDQSFLSAGYAQNPITIIGSDPGVTAEYNGGTHMPFEDMALYRALPGSTVFDITDSVMLRDILGQCADLAGVKYLRVGRGACVGVYAEGTRFEIGRAVELRPGRDAVIFVCGIMVHEAMQAAERLAAEGVSAAVVDVFTVKPLDTEAVTAYAASCGAVVTAENHNRIGGLFSAVSEALAVRYPVPVEWVAVDDRFGQVGLRDYLQEQYALTSDEIVRKTKLAIERKGR